MNKSNGGILKKTNFSRVGKQGHTTYEYFINNKLDIGQINISPKIEKQIEEKSSKIKEEILNKQLFL